MRRWIAMAAAFVLAGPAAPSEAASHSADPTTVLYIHGGGFVGGDPTIPSALLSAAEQQGWEVVSVDYTLGNLPAAVRDVRRAARRAGRSSASVWAYGGSAGGTLAALLAQKGLVDASVVWAPIARVDQWDTPIGQGYLEQLEATPRQMRRASPAWRPSRSPVFAQVASDDVVVDNAATQRWASRDPMVHAETYEGNHLGSTEGDRMRRDSMRFLARALVEADER